MAILLKKNDDFGTKEGANYWKIVEIKSDYFLNKTKVVMSGWTNELSRRSGLQPIKKINIILENVDLVRSSIYQKLSESKEWSQ